MKYFSLLFLLPVILLFGACGGAQNNKPAAPQLTEAQLEAIEDSVKMVQALDQQRKIQAFVTADAETFPVHSSNVDDDAADDMAIWVNPKDAAQSTIIGTNKKGGVVVYGLDGAEKHFYPTGRINNIDVLTGFKMGKNSIDIVGCTNRSDQSVDLFKINPEDGALTDIAADLLQMDTNAMKDVYGFCFYKSDKSYLFVNAKNGMLQQYELEATAAQKIALKFVRQFKFASQTEGMVADERNQVLYVGEEDKGIWKISADPKNTAEPLLVPMSGAENPDITYDVEGLTLYKSGQKGYLIASSQGSYSYAVFEREGNNRYLGSFKIANADKTDGVEETDGIDACSAALGSAFPQGIFVAQDGYNYGPDQKTLQRQNFKIVGWSKIQQLIEGLPAR